MNESARHSVSCALFAVWALGLAACSSAPVKNPGADGAAPIKIRAGSTDEVLASAVVAYRTNQTPAQMLAFVRAAAERSPERADAAWLHAHVCSFVPGCQPEPLEARLKVLDSRNGVVWMGALDRAQRQNDRALETQVLEAMSGSEYFDAYWNSLLWRVAVALKALPAPKAPAGTDPLMAALDETSLWLSVVALPRFEPIARACSAARLADTSIAARCTRVGNALQNGDTYIAEGVGLGIAERAAQPGTPEAFTVAERIETSRYRRLTASRVMAVQLDKNKFSQELVELTQKLRREQDVSLAVLRWAGEPITPQ
jgi:hypothetical protein